MPIPSAIDLRTKELKVAPQIADEELRSCTAQYQPKHGENGERIARRLGMIRAVMGKYYGGIQTLLRRSLKLTPEPSLPDEGSADDIQSALDMLESAFGSVETGSAAESALVAIAHAHARFHAQMEAILEAVESIDTTSAPKAAKPLARVSKKPASEVIPTTGSVSQKTSTAPVESPPQEEEIDFEEVPLIQSAPSRSKRPGRS